MPTACLWCTSFRSHQQRVIRQSIGVWRAFQTSVPRRDEFPNHYATLNVQPGASDKEIKKQFYSLSKSNHPDLHPNDPDASQRFVRITEAYGVLSSTEKRAVYDRDFNRAHQSSAPASAAYPTGSFSSASTPAGGRPASGLSRRRTQFRGPPPSFYQSGGWGDQAAKRAEHAGKPSHSWEGQEANRPTSELPGTGPGGFAHGFQNDVPHFDSQGHYQTHSTIERTRHRARRRIVREAESEGSGSGMVFGFAMVSGILGLAIFVGGVLQGERIASSKASRSENKGV